MRRRKSGRGEKEVGGWEKMRNMWKERRGRKGRQIRGGEQGAEKVIKMERKGEKQGDGRQSMRKKGKEGKEEEKMRKGQTRERNKKICEINERKGEKK